MAAKRKYTMYLRVLVGLCVLFGSPSSLLSFDFFGSSAPKQKKGTEQKKGILPFFSIIEAKKKELASLEDDREAFKKRVEVERKSVEETLRQLAYEVTQVKEQSERVQGDATELANKKMTLLNDRKQNFAVYQDLLKAQEEIFAARVAILNEHIDFLNNKQKRVHKPLYSWQEFREEQAVIAKLTNKVDDVRNKREALTKQESSEKETITSLQKQIEVKTKERDKIITDIKAGDREQRNLDLLKLEADVFSEEINLFKEKVSTLQFKVEHINSETRLKENEVDLISAQLTMHKSDLAIMEERLGIEYRDVETARNEAAAERQKAIALKEEINRKIEVKNLERNKLEARKEKATKDRKRLEERDKQGTIEFKLAKSEEQKIICTLENVVQSIKVLQLKIDRADVDADEKDLLYKMVDFRYKLSKSKIDLEESLAKFKSLRDLVQAGLGRLKLDQQEVMSAFVKDSKDLEDLNVIKEETIGSKDTLFSSAQPAYQQILKNIEIADRALHEHMKMIPSLLVDYSELISSKEKIVNRYNLLIQDIETLMLDEGIWKRSPNAITWEDFQRSLIEAENFLTRFFWDTPTYLGPMSLINSTKRISFTMVLGFVLFVLFYVFLYLAIKLLLGVFLRRAKRSLAKDHKSIGFLWLNITVALLEFLLNRLKILFTLVFIYLHLAFNFRYIFSTIAFLNTPYNLVLFHLCSIPIFVYLSQSFLATIKELNKQLSYMFFAEKLEERFILLITVFCYSTSIMIPFRQAFLSYPTEDPTIFPQVLLTGYSLILAVIWLLFFSKEVVLRLLPFEGKVFDWVRYGIELHYYPVFFFCMGLLILPLIGYSNLAWFLAFAGPATVLLFYTVLMVHYYIRKYALFIFMKEEDDEIVDKFEYAKTYYGLLVIASFLILLFGAFSISSHVWHMGYSPTELWKLLSNEWVIPLGADHKFGVIQFFTLLLFFLGGFVVSSLIQRFVLNKIFDILRTEPGMQNTITRIVHYATVTLATVIGLTSVHLDQLLVYVGAVSAVAIGFVLKDVAADYISGLFILIERPIEIGNFVSIDQDDRKRGFIHKIDARTTTIMNRLNHSLIIPNKEIANKLIANWGKGRFAVGFEMTICIDYFEDVALVRETIAEVIQSNPTILRVPRITVRMEDFNNSQFTYLVRAFISSRRLREQWDIAADLREGIFKAFREKGIEFAIPPVTVHMAKDAKPAGGTSGASPINFKFEE